MKSDDAAGQPGRLPSGERIHMILQIADQDERESLERAFSERGFSVHACVEPAEAIRIFAAEPFETRIVVIDLDCLSCTLSGRAVLARLQRFAEQNQYRLIRYFVGLSDRSDDAALECALRSSGVHFASKADASDLIRHVCANALEIASLKYPQFMPVHLAQEPYAGHCVAGEIVSNIRVRRSFAEWLSLPIANAPRFFMDATLRFSSEHNPLGSRAILQLMSCDSFYSLALGEEALTVRNYITNWYRIRECGLRPVFRSGTDEVAVSEHRAGGETVYYFRGECIPRHVESLAADDL